MEANLIPEEFKDIPVDTMRAIIKERIDRTKNTQFQAWVDLGVAKKIQDRQMEANALKQMTALETAIKHLEDLLKGFP